MKNFVLTSGKDCDGFGSPKIYEFDTEQEATAFAESCNEASDGILYSLATEKEAREYAAENDLNYRFDVSLTKKQLEDFMVTVYEGGSNYWMGFAKDERKKIRGHKEYGPEVSFAEKMAQYLWDGLAIQIVDVENASEVLGEVTLDKINEALNRPEMAEQAESFLNEDFDVETTDVLIQWAIFNEIVYG